MPYLTISYHTKPHNTIPYHTIQYNTIPHSMTPHTENLITTPHAENLIHEYCNNGALACTRNATLHYFFPSKKHCVRSSIYVSVCLSVFLFTCMFIYLNFPVCAPSTSDCSTLPGTVSRAASTQSLKGMFTVGMAKGCTYILSKVAKRVFSMGHRGSMVTAVHA